MDKLLKSWTECETEVFAEVKGEIPEWLTGEMLRIGPGKWDLADDFRLNHWLDGCAILCKFSIGDGKVSFRSKFLESDAYNKMVTVNRPVFTEFGTRAYPDPCKNVFARFFSQIVPSDLTDNSCIGMYKLKDQFYVASETCNVWQFDPQSLKAKQKINLDKLVGVNLASAHVQYIDSEPFAYNLTSSFLKGLKYHIIKIPVQQKEEPLSKEKDSTVFKNASILVSIPSSWSTCITYYHSYAITKNYIIFLEQPLLVNGFKLATCTPKGKPLKDCFEWCPEEKTKFYVVEKSSGKVIEKYWSESIFHFHHINAYEDMDHIVCDIITYDDSSILDKWTLDKLRANEWDVNSPPIPRRYVLPLGKDKKQKGVNLVTLDYTEAKAHLNEKSNIWLIPEQLGLPGFELPTINYKHFNGRKYQFCYGSGVFERGTFANAICKLDVNTKESLIWRESETLYPGECQFIPRPGAEEEDDGVVLSIVLDSDETKPHFLLILEAKTFKELARAEIHRTQAHIPATIHGLYSYNN